MKVNSVYVKFFLLLVILIGCKEGNEGAISSKKDMLKEEHSTPKTVELLVGTFTSEDSKGIYKLDFDQKTGALSNKVLLAERKNPGYLYISQDRKKVYSSNGVAPGSISIYEFTADRSQLNLIDELASKGAGACYIELNDKESLVAAANYGSGSIVVYKLEPSGVVDNAPMSVQHQGSGPHPNQKSPHAHCVKFHPTGKYLYAVDLGADEIMFYEINDSNEIGNLQTALKTDPGDGPRHMVFHPNKNRVFIINELSSTVISANINEQTGTLDRIDKRSTLPEEYTGPNACADIHLSADGQFLYASNRGHNSIAIFSVSEIGELKLLTTEPVHGDWPRNFILSADGEFLLVANERSNNISIFKVNTETGQLNYTGNQVEISRPVCLKF